MADAKDDIEPRQGDGSLSSDISSINEKTSNVEQLRQFQEDQLLCNSMYTAVQACYFRAFQCKPAADKSCLYSYECTGRGHVYLDCTFISTDTFGTGHIQFNSEMG